MQKPLLILASVFVSLLIAFSCSRSNPGAPPPKPVDTTAPLSGEYIVSTLTTFSTPNDYPMGVTIAPDGNFYTTNNRGNIWKVSPAGIQSLVTTMSGRTSDIAADGQGNLYVLNVDQRKILRITPSGVTTVFAGGAANPVDGQGTAAGFNGLEAGCFDNNGILYVLDGENIRTVDPSGLVKTIYTEPSPIAGLNAIAVDGAHNIYYADGFEVLRLDPQGNRTLIAGQTKAGALDGTGANAQFTGIFGLILDKSGNLVVADESLVRLISPAGVVSTIAGSSAVLDSTDGPGNLARFHFAIGVTLDANGAIYIADDVNLKLRKIVHK